MREEVGWKDGPKILNDTFKYIFYILGSKSKLMKTTTTWIRLNLWFSAKYWEKSNANDISNYYPGVWAGLPEQYLETGLQCSS